MQSEILQILKSTRLSANTKKSGICCWVFKDFIKVIHIGKALSRNPYHAEASQFICMTNQLTGLHINWVITYRITELIETLIGISNMRLWLTLK